MKVSVSVDGSASRPAGGGPAVHDAHVVQFYESEEYLCDAVATFLADGLVLEQPVVVIATATRWAQLRQRLNAEGFDVEQGLRSGGIAFEEASKALDCFMVDAMPDADLFRSSIGALIDRVGRGAGAGVRAYGEMVDVLWQDGNPAAALRLEELWNDLARSHSFSLLCAYAMGNFYREADGERLVEVCRMHGHVLPTEGYARDGDEGARLREVARLQQRARALEREVAERTKLELALRQALADRRRTEEALRHAKEEAERANRVKSDFLAVMSHELRTPLNAIVGYRDLMQQGVGGPVTDTHQVYLERIGSGVQQLLRLIDQVLSLSQIEAGLAELTIENVELRALTRECAALVEPIIAEPEVRFLLELPECDVVCSTDAGRLGQILLNLLSNAAKFTDRGEIVLSLREERDAVVFAVRDTGVGIAADDLERVFQPFVRATPTRRTGGTGLGLPVSRELARLLGGHLTAISEPGRGSTFTLRIPRRPADLDPTPAA
jgi:signal transduction histidine kinase